MSMLIFYILYNELAISYKAPAFMFIVIEVPMVNGKAMIMISNTNIRIRIDYSHSYS